MVSYTQYNKPVFWSFWNSAILASFISLIQGLFIHDFVLNKDQSLHRVLQSKLMLTHLWKNSAYIQMNIAWVRNLQAIIYSCCAEM